MYKHIRMHACTHAHAHTHTHTHTHTHCCCRIVHIVRICCQHGTDIKTNTSAPVDPTVAVNNSVSITVYILAEPSHYNPSPFRLGQRTCLYLPSLYPNEHAIKRYRLDVLLVENVIYSPLKSISHKYIREAFLYTGFGRRSL